MAQQGLPQLVNILAGQVLTRNRFDVFRSVGLKLTSNPLFIAERRQHVIQDIRHLLASERTAPGRHVAVVACAVDFDGAGQAELQHMPQIAAATDTVSGIVHLSGVVFLRGKRPRYALTLSLMAGSALLVVHLAAALKAGVFRRAHGHTDTEQGCGDE